MIFVTVGTHEQQFNRLLEEIDTLIEKNVINEEVFAQVGYSTYIPKFYKFSKFIDFDEMQEIEKKARIIITHGGPASFLQVLAKGKNPIIVPRRKKFEEHVNDHQFEFCKKLIEKNFQLCVVDEISELEKNILEYNNNSNNFNSNNDDFIEKFTSEVRGLFS